ncbi:SubName: Full=Uncharacterized protein {ECO:0000313/EMBL:CCA66480.1} [Serendipita indica DSM 11827]|uniref:Rpa49 subunit specific to nuclear RNA polymerase I n=1 Tax=Serendipita indica (strain DSM 11827) TaxID=1109443 RepID=G4T567_SERID|nr:SubName: Full=Uncharacterized protein {ECO:0000313/EMBL:CCA66480.1} [Serendipita indica DSM 11827]CCA66480.1 hypothetical protein PIIN_00165 [Serendipita indica DSM 11827]
MATQARPTSLSKKRKRDALEEDTNDLQTRITCMQTSPGVSGPAFALFPAVFPAEDTLFSAFTDDLATTVDAPKCKSLIGGETANILYTSFNKDKVEPANECQYLVAIRNRRTNELVLSPGPLYIVSHQVKVLQSLDGGSQGLQEHMVARNQLGEAFGTKKAKAALRTAERNKVDVTAMAGVSNLLQTSIEAKTDSLPQLADGSSEHSHNRHIPRYNQDAQSPAEIYPLDSVISEPEFAAISWNLIRPESLPYRKSTWVNERLRRKEGKPSKYEKSIQKVVFYVSAMFYFRRVATRAMKREDLREKLAILPDVIVESLVSRFTEAVRGNDTVISTPQKEAELLTHLLVLCLRVDNFLCDPKILAADLSMSLSSVQGLFKSLGCIIAVPSKAEQSMGQTSDQKMAILRTPFKLPTPSRRKRV